MDSSLPTFLLWTLLLAGQASAAWALSISSHGSRR